MEVAIIVIVGLVIIYLRSLGKKNPKQDRKTAIEKFNTFVGIACLSALALIFAIIAC